MNPLLKIKDLKIEMDANYIDGEKISSLLKKCLHNEASVTPWPNPSI